MLIVPVVYLLLQLMLPNESFVEFVISGQYVGALGSEDLATLAHLSC